MWNRLLNLDKGKAKGEMFSPRKHLEEQPIIELFFEKLPEKIRGLCQSNNRATTILPNKNLHSAERRCVLTEKLTHHYLHHYSDFSLRRSQRTPLVCQTRRRSP